MDRPYSSATRLRSILAVGFLLFLVNSSYLAAFGDKSTFDLASATPNVSPPSAKVTPASAGLMVFNLSCSGPGGAASTRASAEVSRAGTIPVLRSSYEMKAAAGEALLADYQRSAAEVRAAFLRVLGATEAPAA